MIELEVPKDIRKYEAKLFGPFTTRQLICFVIACVVAFFVYQIVGALIPRDVIIFLIIIVDLPVLLCGWFKPYGMAFEKFAKTAFTTSFVSPSVRKYVTENSFAPPKTTVSKKAAMKKQIKSKNPDLVPYN